MVVTFQCDALDRNSVAIELERKIASDILELQYVVLRHRHHRVGSDSERVHFVGLYRRHINGQNPIVTHQRFFPIWIDGVVITERIFGNEFVVDWKRIETARIGSFLPRKPVRTIVCRFLKNADQVTRIPQHAQLLVSVDFGLCIAAISSLDSRIEHDIIGRPSSRASFNILSYSLVQAASANTGINRKNSLLMAK